ncbi:MAG: UvrD-helicase domain-containing protein [Anaerolineae bacterium]|nr:UvrD-helicase domain-containing protein [Anaerolineae bacterium]
MPHPIRYNPSVTYLEDLNPPQRQAVTVEGGPVLVLAGPGSGKTRVLTRRIAHLVVALGVQPYNIIAVTFTNKAARQMRERVEALVPEGLRSLDGIWLGTFHAMCARLLRREAGNNFLPFTNNFVIADDDDQDTLIRQSLKEFNLDDKQYRPAVLSAIISRAKNELIPAEDFTVQNYRDEVARRVYQRYEERLRAENKLDFDDLLLWSVRLLVEQPDTRQRYARRFQHVLVDEFQDTNTVQYELLKLLASHHHNLFVVGDEDQSIYRWRGADAGNVRRFEQDFPDCHKILLEQNYRSTQVVLDAARAVIDRNPDRTPKQLFTERGGGQPLALYEALDDRGEASHVVERIYREMVTRRAKGGEFAVMYRTNAQSRLLEEEFLRAGLPYRLVGAQRFYGRREVKDLIAYLRLVFNPADDLSLLRVINVPRRGAGEKTILGLQMTAQDAGISAGAVLVSLGQDRVASPYWNVFTNRTALALAEFGDMLRRWRQDLEADTPLPALFDRILVESGYEGYLRDGSEEGEERWENVQELRRLAYEYQERGLAEFLENLALVSDQDTLPDQLDAPTLLTLHAAKGLEFDHVFIIGLDEGLLPHSRSMDEPEEMAEERRLFYVGLTRARNLVTLVRAEQRATFGTYEDTRPSRFLQDIPEHLLQTSGVRTRLPRRQRQEAWEQPQRWESKPPAGSAPEPIVRQFQPAMRVRHPSWGEGMVMDSKVQDNEELVDVFFESVGFKRLVASLAKLEVVPKN